MAKAIAWVAVLLGLVVSAAESEQGVMTDASLLSLFVVVSAMFYLFYCLLMEGK